MASVDVVIPVLNEEHSLPRCIEQLRDSLSTSLPQHQCRIVVADNGSTDGTLDVAKAEASAHPAQVAYVHLDVRGRGRALRKAWLESDADVVSYMDVDLSTGLDAFPAMVNGIVEDGYHVAFGSRLAKGAHIKRSPKREVISRTYNLMIRALMQTRFRDAQCGFKALSRGAAQALVPTIVNNHWFFDTELLVIAEKRGFRMLEVPVTWDEDADTRVKIMPTVMEDLKGLARLRWGGIPEVEPPKGLRE
ncbi:MAG: glycosyltransferase family 2 protein [Chloroflexi bacterium]|nr:glycosyltransferase family 2 protein [Chloroflexota bacterium]MDA1173105.1 glycosyltransferase family 2 protein [Chloroflexota bacterium]